MSKQGQRGQALVGVMVTMLILFALAGAVTIGASTLLSGQKNQGRLFADDFDRQSAVTDALAQVAGSGSTKCDATATPAPTPLDITLPEGAPTSGPLTAHCLGMPNSSSNPPTNLHVDWPGAQKCTTVNLSSQTGNQTGNQTGKQWIFFDARTTLGAGNKPDGWAFVDQSQDVSTRQCQSSSLLAACTGSGPNCRICGTDFSSTKLAQVALHCDFSGSTSSTFLHIRNPLQSPRLAFSVNQLSPGGSVYLIAASTGLALEEYEEAVMYVTPSTNILRYEARMP
jgi:hypothetical protein